MNDYILEADFKHAMRRLASTITVVTCAVDGRRFGMTATAVTSVCADPPSLLVCVNRSSSLHTPLEKTGRFCVNLLKVGQESVSAAFGGQKKGEERFSEGSWLEDDIGVPYLASAQANVFCITATKLQFGTHTIFVGQVQNVISENEVSPLIFQDGGFAKALSLS
ncbi:flavin reductase family protein [Burkholderia cepacia]|uniref:flavin reductase family protein n=1 Tax=Burkholderia cepacia TaxID=292 RepID=UPI000F5E0804|nr:flavin reductase family protein [Burkholderia cepacia]MCA8028948.1 flavin reductase family protein [Burkholderia cepacia]RRA20999.1 flavin reductase [Burkholderia cepacia]